MTLRERLENAVPVAVVLVILTALGYPLALLFGLPLARRDIRDLRKWDKATVIAAPLSDVASLAKSAGAAPGSSPATLDFPLSVTTGVLVLDDNPLLPYHPGLEATDLVQATAALPDDQRELLIWGTTLEPLSERVFGLGESWPATDPAPAVYVGSQLMREGTVLSREPPDGQRTSFTFEATNGLVMVGTQLLLEDTDYSNNGATVIFQTPPPFGSKVRRVTGDYAVLDPAAGTLVFSTPPAEPVLVASRVVRLAERLRGKEDGVNRTFHLERTPVLENDRQRLLYLGNRKLKTSPERSAERASGELSSFTFASATGIITVDGVVQQQDRDYQRDGPVVTFTSPPRRNAQVRQHPDYFLIDPGKGEVLLAQAPDPGTVVWAERYTYYASPGCGQTLLACFFSLPQHPVPFPHWIARRIGPFFSKFPLNDERNVVWATLYTTLGTLASLALGGVVGILLAVAFVLLRPLERALLPWVIASQTIPIIALVPVLLLVLGNFGITIQTSLLPTAIIGAYISFFPVVVGTVKGLRSVDPLALDLMRSYAATPLQVFLKVRFPAAVPFFFTSLKLGTAAALVGALVAETESNNRRGLGFQILGQVQSGNVADVWILLLISGLLGISLVALVSLVQRLTAPWEQA